MSRRWAAAALAIALTLLSGLATPIAADAAEGSAVTVSGQGQFQDLTVTVSQNANLINQAVSVSWRGGKPTVDVGVYLDYLQIMQCWGDDASGPRRDQCQFGALYTDTRGGTWTDSRQVSYGDRLIDPLEAIKPTSGQQAYVPFTSVTGGTATTGGGGEFFDATTTNEIPYARTRPDGTGEEYFEVQTAAEAPGLGCGERRTDGTGRSCWLVIVPRGESEVDGSTGDARPHRWLDSSPLSATNWAQRLVVPLKFQPLGQTCPIGGAERRTVGAEAMSEAMLRWQPALCAGSGRVFGYSQLTGGIARRWLIGDDPGLVFVDTPAPPDPKRPQVYAPVAVSGLAVALNVEWQPQPAGGERPQDGRRMTSLNLTPRLVAKLLTQSYLTGADTSRATIAGNSDTLGHDPDFRHYNPGFDNPLDLTVGDLIVPLGQTDLATRLWQWVITDPDARAFLAGTPDPYGMKVNPVYRGQSWPQDNFPKSDLYCIKLRSDAGDARDWCTLDMHPYATSMHDAARAASRGDTLVHNVTARDNVGNVIGWKKGPPQPPGKRAVLAVTDLATAERYGLPTAKLMNAAGGFVAPDTSSLLAGVATMKPSATVPNVLVPDPTATSATAYPLTTVLYAATAPSALVDGSAAGKDYAALLRYAAGPGQVPGVQPGTLPAGYAPLTDALRTRTLAVADTVEKTAGKPVSTPRPSTSAPGTPRSPASAGPGATASTAPSVPSAGSRPNAALPAGKPAGLGSPVPVAQTDATAAHPLGPLRYGLVAALAAGVLTALAGPVLLAIARSRRLRRGGS